LLKDKAKILDIHLKGKQFLVGENLSLADIHIGS
jgi:glutathione S-transferase